MIKRHFRFMAGIFAIFFIGLLFSCGSAPEVQETEPQVQEPEVQEPAAPEPEPQVQEPTPEVQESAPQVQESPDIAGSNASLLKAAKDSRDAAIEQGAQKDCPDAFSALDKELQDIEALMQKEPNTDYSEQLKALSKKYQALKTLARAKQLKQKIENANLQDADKILYEGGCTAYDATTQLFADPASTAEALLASSSLSYEAFDRLFKKAFGSVARDERLAAFNAKKVADEIKCAVAAKQDYTQAVDFFRTGDQNYVTGAPDVALECYTQSKDLFTSMAQTVSQKRLAAQEAIAKAKEITQQSQQIALEADKDTPIAEGVKMAGIEEEGAVLLEADTFTDPESAKVALPETLPQEQEPSLQPASSIQPDSPAAQPDIPATKEAL